MILVVLETGEAIDARGRIYTRSPPDPLGRFWHVTDNGKMPNREERHALEVARTARNLQAMLAESS